MHYIPLNGASCNPAFVWSRHSVHNYPGTRPISVQASEFKRTQSSEINGAFTIHSMWSGEGSIFRIMDGIGLGIKVGNRRVGTGVRYG